MLLLFVPVPTDQWLWLQIWAFCSINEVAKELEEPFMDEKNDIALAGARSHRRPQVPPGRMRLAAPTG